MSNRTPWRRSAAAIASIVLLAACGSSDALGGSVVKDGLGCQPTEVERTTDATPTIEAVAKPPADVDQEDLEKGKGCAIDTDTYVTLDLVGATASDAKVFTDTFATDRPVTATIGSGQLLAGLETGLEGMKVGGRRQVTIPADQAYGKEGNPAQGIAADQALVFVVDLVAVSDTPLYCNAATVPAGPEGSGKPTTVEMPVEAPDEEVATTDLKEGTGDPVEAGNYVTLNYLGVSCASGQQFDSSWDNGQTFPVTLGEGTIPGFATGIEGMKVGGLRQIEIPPALGYGAAGSPPAIGSNDPLVFIIELVEAADAPPATTTTPPPATTAPADGSTTTVPAEGTTTTTAPADEDATTTTTEP